jgi:hypothetical protein
MDVSLLRSLSKNAVVVQAHELKNSQGGSVTWLHLLGGESSYMDPDLHFANPVLYELLRYWDCKKGFRPIPARCDIEPLDLKRHLGRLQLVDLEYDPFRQRFRLFGTTTASEFGYDLTGRYFDELYPPHQLAKWQSVYTWIANNRKPLRLFGELIIDPSPIGYPIAGSSSPRNTKLANFEVVKLPLSDDGVRVNMVLVEIALSLSDRFT